MDELTVGDIQGFKDAGLTPAVAQEWSDWYLDVHLANPNNPTAWERSQLMQYIGDWLTELE